MFRLTALIDGHSGIYPSQIGYHLYALRLYHFTDGYLFSADPIPVPSAGNSSRSTARRWKTRFDS